jgi:hypothetical protein
MRRTLSRELLVGQGHQVAVLADGSAGSQDPLEVRLQEPQEGFGEGGILCLVPAEGTPMAPGHRKGQPPLIRQVLLHALLERDHLAGMPLLVLDKAVGGTAMWPGGECADSGEHARDVCARGEEALGDLAVRR